MFVVYDLGILSVQKRLHSQELINVNCLESTNSKEKDGPQIELAHAPHPPTAAEGQTTSINQGSSLVKPEGKEAHCCYW